MSTRKEPSHQLRRAAMVFWFFKKSVGREKSAEKLAELDKQENEFSRIRCPLCRWQPKASSVWYCAPRGDPEYFFEGCGTSWNTFATRGLCPGCAHQWRYTACLQCSGWSLHEDWYVESED
jgi:hypothetical protein